MIVRCEIFFTSLDRFIYKIYIYSECPKTGRPVWRTGHKSVRFSDFRFSDVRFPTFKALEPEDPKTGYNVRFSDVIYIYNVRKPDIKVGKSREPDVRKPEVWKPDAFSSGSPNRTSGFRTSTVFRLKYTFVYLMALTYTVYAWIKILGCFGSSLPSVN